MLYARLISYFTLTTIFLSLSIKASDLEKIELNGLIAFGLAELSRTDKGKDVHLAIESLDTAANKGSKIAIHALGLAHLEGIGIDPSKSKAFEFFIRGAEKNYPPSQNSLGNLYLDGFPYPTRTFFNYRQATKLFQAAAKQGYGPAEYNLGNAYRTGRGITKDLELAHSWFKKAAGNDIAEAQYFLAVSYERGASGIKNIEQAFYWFCKAANELVQAELIIEKRYGGVNSCPSGTRRIEPEPESIISSNWRKKERAAEKYRAQQTRTLLTNTLPADQESRGEELLDKFLVGLGNFLVEVLSEVIVQIATEVIVYKVLDIEPGQVATSYYQPTYSGSYKKTEREKIRRPIYGQGASLYNGNCSCECVNGLATPICTDAASARPVCVAACPPVVGSARPPSISAPHIPGTSHCQNEQVYDWDTRQYKWQRFCR